MLCNLPDCLQMWLEMEAEGKGPNGRPVHPLCCQISCLFSKRGKDVQINRRRCHDSVSCCRSHTAAMNFSVGCFEVFLSNGGLLACLGQPTYVAHSRKRVKGIAECSLPLSETLSPHSEDCALVAAHPCALTLSVWNYFCTGSCVWLLCRDSALYNGCPVLEPPGF